MIVREKRLGEQGKMAVVGEMSVRMCYPTFSSQMNLPPTSLQTKPVQHGVPDVQSALTGKHMPVPPSGGGGGGGASASSTQNGLWLSSVSPWNGRRNAGKLASEAGYLAGSKAATHIWRYLLNARTLPYSRGEVKATNIVSPALVGAQVGMLFATSAAVPASV